LHRGCRCSAGRCRDIRDVRARERRRPAHCWRSRRCWSRPSATQALAGSVARSSVPSFAASCAVERGSAASCSNAETVRREQRLRRQYAVESCMIGADRACVRSCRCRGGAQSTSPRAACRRSGGTKPSQIRGRGADAARSRHRSGARNKNSRACGEMIASAERPVVE
jgi:hypothetical protein